jgi:hypothetical protein
MTISSPPFITMSVSAANSVSISEPTAPLGGEVEGKCLGSHSKVIHRSGVLNICVKCSVKWFGSMCNKMIFLGILDRPVSDPPIKGF